MNYVCGFLFHPQHKAVVLIEKTKPEYQKGFLNGVGGKIDLVSQPGIAYGRSEEPVEAMVREFSEEAGVVVPTSQWKLFRVERFKQGSPDGGLSAQVYWFAATATPRQWDEVKTMEEEAIIKWSGDITSDKLMYNLKYLLPMAEVLMGQPPENIPEP